MRLEKRGSKGGVRKTTKQCTSGEMGAGQRSVAEIGRVGDEGGTRGRGKSTKINRYKSPIWKFVTF